MAATVTKKGAFQGRNIYAAFDAEDLAFEAVYVISDDVFAEINCATQTSLVRIPVAAWVSAAETASADAHLFVSITGQTIRIDGIVGADIAAGDEFWVLIMGRP